MFSLTPRVLVPVAAAFGFLGLAVYIASGQSFAFDRSLVLLFRVAGDPSTPVGPAWLREAMRDVSGLGSFVGLGMMTICATLTLWLCGFRHLAVGLALSVIAATLVSTGLKIAIGRERPDIVEHSALTFTASFPSGHAFLSAVTLLSIAGFIGLASRRRDITRVCLWLAWFMIVMIGISRVYLGVHWPTDVLAGWCLGVAWSSLAVAYLGRKMAAAEPAQEASRSPSLRA
ncbi:PAP2 family protein [Bosea caraganae]|uniref:PAP2 family protein n=1 Tax=Bosea caraganae TaxID=2763117 RepID=A0A370L4F3_9HYPH|nr:phosphatase PAP2 family protein [Bosea caraganae]RDJ22323.1 PAP2 family protein [Bosea caraganae]RDJ23743.1 PAP2 family protein [Bosea caraganae]